MYRWLARTTLSLVVCIAALSASALASAAEEQSRAARQSAAPVRMQAVPAQPARVKKLKAAPGDPRYKCEDGECECKGVLDCRDLLDSGFCNGKEFWQDGKDPSVGGCG